MADLPLPRLVQLDPPGPYVTQEAQGFLGLNIVEGRLAIQLRFVLQNGSELNIPVAGRALARLYAGLKGQLEEKQS